MSNRDTHFKGFAELLLEDLKECGAIPTFLNAYYAEHARTLIAQRAYDLMEHIMLYAPAAPVPDLTKWPDAPSDPGIGALN